MPEEKKPKSKGGRPSGLTEEILAQTALLLPKCPSLETLAPLIGTSRRSLFAWLARGRAEEQRLAKKGTKPAEAEAVYLKFLHLIKKGLAELEAKHLDHIAEAGAESWQASAWILERRWPERWGRDRGEIAELRKQLTRLEKALGASPRPAQESEARPA